MSTYQDMLGDKKLSVRVDTKYVAATYVHTYYVQVKYCEETTIALPSKSFLMSVANLETTPLFLCLKALNTTLTVRTFGA